MSIGPHWLYLMTDMDRAQLFIGDIEEITCPRCDDSGHVFVATHAAKAGELVALRRTYCICNKLLYKNGELIHNATDR